MQLYSLLPILLIIVSCNGLDNTSQLSSRPKDSLSTSTPIPAGQLGTNNQGGNTASQIGKRIRRILQDKAGNFWFATNGDGVCRYDPSKDGFTYFTKKDGLCSDYVWTMVEDKVGNIWFGTEDGVSRYDPATGGFTTFRDKEGLCNLQVGSSLEDKNGNIWFGNDAGVCRYDPATGGFAHFNIAAGKDGHRKMNSPYAAYCMFEDQSGNIWVGTPQKGLCRYDPATGKLSYFTEKGLDRVLRGIFQDKSGMLWFGMNGGGVVRYDGTTFTNFSEEIGLSRNLSLSNLGDKSQQLDRVWTIAEDLSGNIWFGTVEEGVWRYDGKNMTNFTVKDGLSSNTIWSIFVDNAGILWFGTEEGGVCKYDGNVFVNFTKNGAM